MALDIYGEIKTHFIFKGPFSPHTKPEAPPSQLFPSSLWCRHQSHVRHLVSTPKKTGSHAHTAGQPDRGPDRERPLQVRVTQRRLGTRALPVPHNLVDIRTVRPGSRQIPDGPDSSIFPNKI